MKPGLYYTRLFVCIALSTVISFGFRQIVLQKKLYLNCKVIEIMLKLIVEVTYNDIRISIHN